MLKDNSDRIYTLQMHLEQTKEEDEWLVSLLINIRKAEGPGISWSPTEISNGILGVFLAIAVCEELGVEIEVEQYEFGDANFSYAYGLKNLPRRPEISQVPSEHWNQIINTVRKSLLSLPENIVEQNKHEFLDTFEWHLKYLESRISRGS